jgi:hypothetical protein
MLEDIGCAPLQCCGLRMHRFSRRATLLRAVLCGIRFHWARLSMANRIALARADAVACQQVRRSDQVRGHSVNAFTVIADLRAPEIFDLPSLLGRAQHAPAMNAQLAVCKRNCCQFHGHAVKLSDESFNVEVRHFSVLPRVAKRLHVLVEERRNRSGARTLCEAFARAA